MEKHEYYIEKQIPSNQEVRVIATIYFLFIYLFSHSNVLQIKTRVVRGCNRKHTVDSSNKNR